PLFGLPVGADMDGKPWLHAFDHPVSVETIPSWEEVPGPCGMHSAERRGDPFGEHAALAQLVELGYLAAPPEDGRKAAAEAVWYRDFNLAQSLLCSGRPAAALVLLERLHAGRPDHLYVAFHLANACYAAGRWADCRRVVEHIAAGHCSGRAMED